MREELVLVEREVRRRDDGDRVCTECCRVLGERDGVGSRLRATVHRDLQAPCGRFVEAFRHAAALVDGEQHALAGRPESEDPVEPVSGEEVDVSGEGGLVDRHAVARERRERGRDRSPQHAPTLESPVVANLRVERDGSVLRVTLARPDRRNAFDAELIRELAETFVDVGRVRAVVLAGDGTLHADGAPGKAYEPRR